MRILVVESDVYFASQMRSSLETAGHSVALADRSQSALGLLRTSRYDVALINFRLPDQSGLMLIKQIRRGRSAKALPVILIAPSNINLNADAIRQTLHKLRVNEVVPRSIPVTTLPEIIQKTARRRTANGTANDGTDPEGFRLLAGIWSGYRSGHLSNRNVPGVATFMGGDPLGMESKALALGCLNYGGGLFEDGELSGSGRVERIGAELLAAAKRMSDPAALDVTQILSDLPGAPRANALHLSPATRRILDLRRSPWMSIAELSQEHDLQIEDIRQDLSALIALGLFRLRPPRARPSATRTRRPDRTSRRPNSGNPISAEMLAAFELQMIKRLRREWELVKNADDWTVLGIPPDANASLIAHAAERMRERYREQRVNSNQARKLLRLIGERVETAVSRIQSGEATLDRDDVDQETQAFEQGLEALQARDFSRAARLFGVARRHDSSSSQNLGYLGWAIYNDPQREVASRREEGLELLRLADTFDSANDDLQYYQAFAEFEAGELNRSRARLSRLLRRNSGHMDARRLFNRLRAN